VPRPTIVEIPPEEQGRMRAELRRARYGNLLALHLLLLCAAGRTPSEVAAVLFCSRSSVYRIVQAYRAGTLTFEEASERTTQQRRLRLLTPSLKRSVHALLKTTPRAFGWCRTRWSCATLAVELQVRRGIKVSAETMRLWLHDLGWAWKRAKVAAKDDDPDRVTKLARICLAFEQLRSGAALFLADELDVNLLPKVGYHWMPKGKQIEVLTPGTNEKRYLAGALDLTTGTITPCVWYRKQTGLFLDLLETSIARTPRRSLPTSPSSPTTRRFTKPQKSSNGSRRIRASSCSTYRPTVPAPTRLSGRLVMSLTSVPVTIPANASGPWCRM
jgi:transposase